MTFFHATAAEKRQKQESRKFSLILTIKIAIKVKTFLHQNVPFVTTDQLWAYKLNSETRTYDLWPMHERII